MRQLIALVPRGYGKRALQIAQENEGMNLALIEASGTSQPKDMVILHVPNVKVDSVLGGLGKIDDAEITIAPQGVMPLAPPASDVPKQTTDVTSRSPLEIFLGGLQSIGSWKGFLGYAACAGAVAWIGLFTNTVYLLTASMLIAPFAGPAMTLALGTARGDRLLIRQSVLRYFSSILLTVVIAYAFTLVMGLKEPTELMISNGLISSVTMLLPLVAGAAGALNLCQSQRNSLVTAAGPGMLIAASLAPPAAVVGMSAALGQWDMAKTGTFVLLLQLVGINLSGSIVFALFGLSPKGIRYDRGRGWLRWTSYGVTTAALAGLLFFQFRQQPELQHSARSKRALHDLKVAVQNTGFAKVVEASVRFTRADIPGQNSLLIVAYVQRDPSTILSDEAIRTKVTRQIIERIHAEGYNVTPLVSVTVLESGSTPQQTSSMSE